MGTQKNHLNETVLLGPKHMLKIMGKKIFKFYSEMFCLSKPVAQDSINTGTTFVCDSTNFSIAIL